ncbi:MAG: hypothetical protein ACI9G1_005119, partial [Pirellulaceae bacterium]
TRPIRIEVENSRRFLSSRNYLIDRQNNRQSLVLAYSRFMQATLCGHHCMNTSQRI